MPSLARRLPQNHRYDGICTEGRSREVSGAGMDGYISKPTRIEAIDGAFEDGERWDDAPGLNIATFIGAGISYHLYNKNGKDQ